MKIMKFVPGLFLLLAITLLSKLVANALPSYIGPVFIAVLLGILINNTIKIDKEKFSPGIKLGLNKFLKFAIILLGAEMSFNELLRVGGKSLIVIITVILGVFALTFLIGSRMELSLRKKILISVGLSICGNTAIVTAAPLIDAEEEEVFMAVGIVTLFGVFAVFVYPLIGMGLNMSDALFGAWTGTGIYDTSQVVAAGFSYSEAAGKIGTLIKLTRNIMMVPVIFLVSYFYRKSNNTAQKSVNVIEIFPMFILGFLLVALLNSIGFIPQSVSAFLVKTAKILIILALSGIGLGVDLKKLKKLGFKPFALGFTVAGFMGVISFFLSKLFLQ